MKNLKFKKLLIDLRLSQREFCKEAGISEPYLSNWIHGKFDLPAERQAQIVEAINKHTVPWMQYEVDDIFGEVS